MFLRFLKINMGYLKLGPFSALAQLGKTRQEYKNVCVL